MKNLKSLLTVTALCSVFSLNALALEIRFEEDRTLPLVDVNLVVKAGSAHDPKGQSGITNFVGEMLLRGTKNKTKDEIQKILDQIGGSIDVETRAESLIIRGSVLAGKLSEFLNLLTELTTESSFPDYEIKKLKSEIVSSLLEERGNDKALGRARWESFLFKGHPYGNPLEGKIKDIEALSREQITNHYKMLFQTGNVLLIGAGSTEAAFIQNWATQLSDLLPTSNLKIIPVSAPKENSRLSVRIVDKPDRTQTQVYLGQTGITLLDPRFFSLYLGNHAFGGGTFSARLMVEIRVKRGWSYGAYSYFRHGLQPRSWQAFYFPASKDTAESVRFGLKMIQDVRDHGITQEEFDFAKQSLINSSGFTYNTPLKRVENLILEKTLNLPDGFMKSYASELQKVTLESTNTALKGFLKPEAFSILVLGTAKTLKPVLAEKLNLQEKDIEVVPYTVE